jgi:hypothetical protein
VRDDLKSLPLPPEAKAYARRSGLAAMKKQPQSFINMAAAVSNQRSKKHGFKNTDEVGTVSKAIKECARLIVQALTESDGEVQEYKVKRHAYPDGTVAFSLQVPNEYLNILQIKGGEDEVSAVEHRMRFLAKYRQYPTGSFFTTPWGMYLIHGGTVGKI